METKQWDRAESLLASAVEASPSDAEARRNLAETLWQQGSNRDAVVHMETAVQLDPRHAPTLIRSGEMLLELGAIERARQRADQAIKMDPTLAGGWALRGRIYRQSGELERGLADLQRSLRFAPHDTSALLEVAQIQHELGHPQRSLSTLHYLLDIYPLGDEPQQVLWLEGLVYDSLGRHQEAAESLQTATLRGVPQAELLFHLAKAEQAAGNREAAASTLQRAIALDEAHEPSRILLARLQEEVSTSAQTILR